MQASKYILTLCNRVIIELISIFHRSSVRQGILNFLQHNTYLGVCGYFTYFRVFPKIYTYSFEYFFTIFEFSTNSHSLVHVSILHILGYLTNFTLTTLCEFFAYFWVFGKFYIVVRLVFHHNRVKVYVIADLKFCDVNICFSGQSLCRIKVAEKYEWIINLKSGKFCTCKVKFNTSKNNQLLYIKLQLKL